jgi:hypothetical protein
MQAGVGRRAEHRDPPALTLKSVSALRRTGTAAIFAGALIFAGQGGELVFGSPSDLVDAVFAALWGGGVVALGLAFGGFRILLRDSRAGRIAAWLGIAGSALLAVFAVQTMVAVARTGDVPEEVVLFAFEFLLLFLAPSSELGSSSPSPATTGTAWTSWSRSSRRSAEDAAD